MPDHAIIPPMVLLVLGLYYAAIGLGGFTAPTHWQAMVREMRSSPFEQLMGGAVAFLVGVLLLFAGLSASGTPAVIVRLLGVMAMVKGLAFLALPGRFLAFTDALLTHRSRTLSLVAIGIGLALILFGAFTLRSLPTGKAF